MTLEELQHDFTHYALGSDATPPPSLRQDLAPSRMRVYRRLVLNTTRAPLDGGFPYTARVVGKKTWRQIRWAYFEAHPPLDWELNATVAAFPKWLRETWLPTHKRCPAHAADLADYERHELTVYLAPDIQWRGQTPELNPTLAIRAYKWDIAAWVKQTKGKLKGKPVERDTHLAIYRDPDTLLVRFLDLNPLTATVLQLLTAGSTPAMIAAQLSNALGLPEQQAMSQLDGLLGIFKDRGLTR